MCCVLAFATMIVEVTRVCLPASYITVPSYATLFHVSELHYYYISTPLCYTALQLPLAAVVCYARRALVWRALFVLLHCVVAVGVGVYVSLIWLLMCVSCFLSLIFLFSL